MIETGRRATVAELAAAEKINPSYVSRGLRQPEGERLSFAACEQNKSFKRNFYSRSPATVGTALDEFS
jgi:hypothetical protein